MGPYRLSSFVADPPVSMNNALLRTALSASAILLANSSSLAQEGTQPAQASPAVDAAVDATVAATVDGFAITEEDVERRFMAIIAEQTRGQMVPPEQLAELRQNFRPQILEELIDDRLLDKDAELAQVELTEEELVATLTRSFDGQLLRSDYTRAGFEEKLQALEGITIEQLLARQAEDRALKQALLHIRLIEARYPETVVMTDEAVKERYERDLASFYTKPEMVRASHILLGTDQMSEEEALAKATTVLVECRKEGADFAELAKANSTGPSAPTGGDLDFFAKEAMVAPFADAAFAMQVGEISDPVKSEFGYHIILVTDRRETRIITLEQASPSIQDELRFEKVGPLRETHLAKLREVAKIDYVGQVAPSPAPPTEGTEQG